jgi:cation-transporting ATPase F
LKHSILKLGLISNLWLVAGVLTMVLLQLAFTYVPLMNTIFQSGPIDAKEWMVILASSVVVFLLAEADKWRFRRKERAEIL